MNPVDNPYRPGAGTQPLTLAGRSTEIGKGKLLFQRVQTGQPQRSLMLYGLRGVGKTVLLNRLEELSVECGYVTDFIEISEGDDFKKTIATTLRKILLRVDTWESVKDKAKRALGVLKAFTVALPDGPELKIDVDALAGTADSGNFQQDLTDLMLEVGTLAKSANRAVCVLIDETQYLGQEAFGALIAASHRLSQKSLPVVIVCAGLPQIAALSGEAKSYAERLFEFIQIGNLPPDAAREALAGPAQLHHVTYEPAAVDDVLGFTEGYPYFVQEYGKHAWDIAGGPVITKADVANARAATINTLDGSFFKVRLDRATDAEKLLMRKMASLGAGPYKMSDLTKAMKKKGPEALGPARASLIAKGLLYAPKHGLLAFTVPHFDQFMLRHQAE